MKNYTDTEIRTHDLPTHFFLLQPSFLKTFMMFQKMPSAEVVAPCFRLDQIFTSFRNLSRILFCLLCSNAKPGRKVFFVILTFVATNKAAASVEVKPPRETLLEFPSNQIRVDPKRTKKFFNNILFSSGLGSGSVNI